MKSSEQSSSAEGARPPIADARDEHEICALFEDMLRLRLAEDSSKAKEVQLTDEGLRRLASSNLINRVFRSWYQLNWLYDTWHDLFVGATFRQEFSACRKDIWEGKAMLSVRLSPEPPFAIEPRLVGRDELDEANGAFMFGLRQLEDRPDGVVAPNFDPDFRQFAASLVNIKSEAEAMPSYRLDDKPDWLVYWRLFLEMAASTIAKSVDPKLSVSEQERLTAEISELINAAADIQNSGKMQYILTDHLCDAIWYELRKLDTTLKPFDEAPVPESQEQFTERTRNEREAHSMIVFYRLAYLLDAHFLFPADRYFNAVEIVWQDQDLFTQNLFVMCDLINNNKREMKPRKDADKYLEQFFANMGVSDNITNIEHIWFNPPTCFRFHDWALDIVR